MRFESVTAEAFGPLVEKTLLLAPGMNVIYGVNEAAKSSWHAALYAALCGRRRGKGKQPKEDMQFEEKRRPWNHDDWRVSTIVELEDGRRIEIKRDLLNSTTSVMDADLGRNYESEIVSDGSPDGSVWLGLDRRSFLATACVRQAEVQKIIEEPEELQVHMQRAADTLGADSTAALALERIDDAISEKVGYRTYGKKPLPVANERLLKARGDLDHARDAHKQYLKLLEQARELEEKRDSSERRLRVAKASEAINQANKVENRFERAKLLQESFPVGRPTLASEDNHLLRISETLQQWNNRPPLIELNGQSAANIRQELNNLPAKPLGDLQPAVEVEQAAKAYEQAKLKLQLHTNNRPVVPNLPETCGATKEELNKIAEQLAESAPRDDSELHAHFISLRKRKKRRSAMLVFGGCAVVIGALILFLGYIVPGTAILVAGIALAGIPAIALHGLGEELRDVGNKLEGAQGELATWRSRHDQLVEWLDRHQLPGNSTKLLDILTAIEEVEKGQGALSDWTGTNSRLAEKVNSSTMSLLELLAQHGTRGFRDPDTALNQYRQDCYARARQAAEADRRPNLQQSLNDRISLETAAAEAITKRKQAEELLKTVANECRFSGEDLELLASQLLQLKNERTNELDGRSGDWSELQGLLGGKTLSNLEQEAKECRSGADSLGSAFEEAELALAVLDLENDAHLIANLQSSASQASEELARTQGQIEERQGSLRSVAEAEEALEDAEKELELVRLLKDTLEKTRSFLAAAQERVHRDIAPVLSESIRRRLPSITSGRYSDVRIDPETLSVKVCGRSGEWREAAKLSHGTAEQIFLLLRVALAEYLTPNGKVCPLILDDVTVHCDAERTELILEALHSISRERQIILFSQETEVLEWAEQNLHDPEDLLIRLDATAIPA